MEDSALINEMEVVENLCASSEIGALVAQEIADLREALQEAVQEIAIYREALQALRAVMRRVLREDTKAALAEGCLVAVALADQVYPVNNCPGMTGGICEKGEEA